MRVAVVVGGVPNPTSGGGALTAWSVVSYLASAGHEVAVLPLLEGEFVDPRMGAAARFAALRALGVTVIPVAVPATVAAGAQRGRLRRLVRPSDAEVFPAASASTAVLEAVRDMAPEVVFVYHFEGLVASRALAGRVPRLAAVGDPPHLPPFYRRRAEPRALSLATARSSVRARTTERGLARTAVDLLRECEAAGAFAAHHAAWLRSRGVKHCAYLRTPVPDPLGPDWRAARDSLPTRERPRILLVGHFRGVVTLDGLGLFATGVLPRLEAALGRDGFEVRVMGGYDPPEELRKALDRPSVHILGHVEEPTEEFQSADVLLVPNEIPLGVRVRILVGFSYGCCVVTHSANALGIPELAHGKNAMLGHNADDLVRHVLRALAEPDLRRELEAGGRMTYDRFFRPDVAGARIASILESLATGRGKRPATAGC